ncbi:MAG: hypothetical protein ABSH20_27830 [Tepidisphaeraceae bacterium]
MTLSIALPPDQEQQLTVRAAAAGKDLTTYVQDIIRREISAPLTFVEAAEPFARAIDASGETDADLRQTLEAALAESRNARRQLHRS